PVRGRYDSNAGERSAPGFSSAGSNSVYGLTFPRAADTDSATPGWRACSVDKNCRISPRTLALSEHTQPTVASPRARAYAAVSCSLTNTSGGTSRGVPLREAATGGSDGARPL